MCNPVYHLQLIYHLQSNLPSWPLSSRDGVLLLLLILRTSFAHLMLSLSSLPPPPQADVPCLCCLLHLPNLWTILFACVDYFACRGKCTKGELWQSCEHCCLLLMTFLQKILIFPCSFSSDILKHTLSTTSGSFSKCSIPVLLDLGLCNSPKDSSNPFMTISVCHCFHLFHPSRIRIHQSSCKDMVNSIVASPFLLLGLDYVVIRSKSSFSESLLNYN